MDGQASAFLWLVLVRSDEENFIGSVFEIPKEFANVRVGDEVRVQATEVMDWMVNDKGLLHGGYSLRYQRAKLAPKDRKAFDERIGVTRYA